MERTQMHACGIGGQSVNGFRQGAHEFLLTCIKKLGRWHFPPSEGVEECLF
jgi:hypothetical protein